MSAASERGARKWNSWWSRRSPNIETNDRPPVRIGIDAGSKTLKLVTLDAEGEIVHGLYHRHRSDVRTSLAELIHDVIWRYGDMELPVAITGSAGIALAEALGLPFVQEVIATSRAVKARYPQADCIVELGGEDAKITYLTGAPEQRMNATCAGGTGDFIDGIASMLGCKTREISKLAFGSQRTYPIASRCAVFAQTDVRPLINAGVPKADIAQSALEAVVNQTLGGLACGRPISGNVVFLGGPLEHIPALLMTFKRKLALTHDQCIKPPDAHLFTAMGAVLAADDPPSVALSELERRLNSLPADSEETGIFPPLFESRSQMAEFSARHAGERIVDKRLENVEGPLFLGFDAGSTTMKYVLVDRDGALVTSDYRTAEGDTFNMARAMIEELTSAIEAGNRYGTKRFIAHAAVTGYGEDLLREGFRFDEGIVETIAHMKAAQHVYPDVSFMLDIGGQDMKALWMRDGMLVDAVLNEACSSGCGAFVASCAKSLGLTQEEFSRQALEASSPVDLGAKCTVFMTSRVRHAQKTGTPTGDIAAGVVYSIANNVMSRLIGTGRAGELGDTVVVQGGAFKSDAVLRAFEKVAGVKAVRPNIAHLMGAFGAALAAREHFDGASRSRLLGSDEVKALKLERSSARCTGCGNACLLSIVDFGNGNRFINGNRCERAYAAMLGEFAPAQGTGPNVVELEQRLLARYKDVEAGPFTVGIMNTLNSYENMPFWHTLFSRLGFSVIVPDDRRGAPFADRARETIPSESVCFPAKLSHMRFADLASAGASAVFVPRYARGTRCPVVAQYADALSGNVGGPVIASPTLASIEPGALAANRDDLDTLFDLVSSWDASIDRATFDEAIEAALGAQDSFEQDLCRASESAFAWVRADASRRAAVLATRPYLVDPALLHDIDRELARLGFAVVPQLCIEPSSSDKPLWKPATRLTRLVSSLADDEQVEVVALRAFGCMYDAVSFDEARDLAARLHRPLTDLKVDEIIDTAHVRIRLRTLAYTTHGARPSSGEATCATCATPDLCSTAKALVDIARTQVDGDGQAERVRLPRACLKCLNEAVPFELQHLGYDPLPIDEYDLQRPSQLPGRGMKVGLLGNPLIVFNPDLNEHVDELLADLGCQVVYPQPELIAVEDVRYPEQLERFRAQGVERIIYLQSFGCLKGHVQSRGAARDLARRFPDLPITIIDYDPESSALNRENRIRLAVVQ
ncbi:MAG: hypothetical protein IJ087_08975 [Eggerthellaceae bacterium]|nr:hypothetical protein [Eggerthellaceae bacterium]